MIQRRVNVVFDRENNILIKRFRDEGIRDVVLSNSDIKFLDGSIDRMIKSLRDRKDAVVIGPKILTGGCRLEQQRLREVMEIGRIILQRLLVYVVRRVL